MGLFGKPKLEQPREFDIELKLGQRYCHSIDDYNVEHLVNSGFQSISNTTLVLSVYFYHTSVSYPALGSYLYPIYVTVGSKFVIWKYTVTVLEIYDDRTIKLHITS
jgi:hypothetical protein